MSTVDGSPGGVAATERVEGLVHNGDAPVANLAKEDIAPEEGGT